MIMVFFSHIYVAVIIMYVLFLCIVFLYILFAMCLLNVLFALGVKIEMEIFLHTFAGPGIFTLDYILLFLAQTSSYCSHLVSRNNSQNRQHGSFFFFHFKLL